ncbi:hypothetical protein BaRGS_00027698, partial [Batillaria attramentaria]
KPRVDEGHRGLVYGSDPIDNSPARGIRDPFGEKSTAELQKLHREQEEAREDIMKFKQEKMMQDFQRQEEKKKEDGNRRRKFLETDVSPRDIPAYTTEPQKPHRDHDLFINTLGGPAGTAVRGEHGYPALQSMPDPRIGTYRSPGPGGNSREQERKMDLANEEKRIADQEQKIRQLKKELEFLKSPRDQPARGPPFDPRDADRPSNGMMNDLDGPRRPPEQRSLDLENSRGGAGAPVRDDRGKPITRFPVTMERDDYGSSKIRENIPGKRYTLPDEENPIFDPWGRPGGGAPVKDRYGNVTTNTFGNFEKKTDSAEQRKKVRAKEVMLHDLRAGMEEQRRIKEAQIREQKAPQGELAELVRRGQVGKPRRDPITGTLTNQHLPNSDVSKIVSHFSFGTFDTLDYDSANKMNYQPKQESEKKMYHDELTRLAEDRKLNRQLEKMRDQQESNKHFESLDRAWGHSGGGAPKDPVIRKKVNLENALHHYDRPSRSEDLHRQKPQYGLRASPQPQAARGDEYLPDPRQQHRDYGLGAAPKAPRAGVPPYATQGSEAY